MQNRNGKMRFLRIVFLATACGIFVANSAFAQTWTQTGAPSNYWASIASSADGSRLVAGAFERGIFTSTNSGLTWMQTSAPNENWWSIASSADGMKLVAAAGSIPGGVYTSTDGGSTWVSNNLPIESWSSVASSADGSKLVAVAPFGTDRSTPGAVFTSTNSGSDWTSNTVNGISVASSADGTKLFIVDALQVWRSTNSGTTWTQIGNGLLSGGTAVPSQEIACSADGNKLVLASITDTNNNPGPIYTSTNAGDSWQLTSAPANYWGYVASSADGSTILAVAYPNSFSAIYVSTNSGATWTSNNSPVLGWGALACSADGGLLIAAALSDTNYNGSWIYTLQTTQTPPPPVITNQPTGRALWAGGYVTLSVGVSNGGPFTYQWQLNGTNLPNNIITTVAGNGAYGYSGDGYLATNAELYNPTYVAVDGSGNLFIADSGNNRVRKVSTNGIITTVAGNGPSGNWGTYSGDGGTATNAGLSQPEGLALDASGNLFIADFYNQRIRKVTTDGIITTIAGNGTNDYSGDGGMATNASLYYPAGMALDAAGNLFIADSGNNRIREVGTSGVIMTVAGGGINYPGNGGMATNASMNNPSGVAVDTCGNLFIADTSNDFVRKVGTDGIITTVAGLGYPGYSGDGYAATNAGLNEPFGISADSSGNLFIADTANNRVRVISANGTISTVAGNGLGGSSGDGGPAANATLNNPFSVAVDASGNLFIADTINHRIRKVTNNQGPTLALNNVTAANGGNYQVVVTGPGGSVTSSVVNLVVASSPQIYRTAINSNRSISLNFLSLPGSTNVVLCTTNLSSPVWQSISTNIAGPDGNWQFTDTNAANFPTLFYRSQTQ
jgi:hypothetical protein